MKPIVNVESLTVQFDDFTAVNDITFSVDAGEVRGILGGNGAGKSTTLKVLAGVLKSTSGSVHIHDIPLDSYRGQSLARRITGYCPDVGGLVAGATPLEHIRLLASLHGDKTIFERGKTAIERFNLNEFRNSPVSGFSHGMMRRLSVMLAYLSADKLLILDEPYDGVDPLGVDIINDVITDAQDAGIAVIISTHLQSLLTDVSDNINIMAKGQLLDVLPADSLQGDAGATKYREMLNLA